MDTDYKYGLWYLNCHKNPSQSTGVQNALGIIGVDFYAWENNLLYQPIKRYGVGYS